MTLSEQPEYQIWSQMKGRCNNKKHKKYPNYGGRGIFVCARWMEKGTGYTNFINDMGYRPSNRHSIERIDVNGPYSPENCIWLLLSEQGWNRTDNSDIAVGDVIGKLTVLFETEGRVRNTKGSKLRREFMTRCVCGNEKPKRMDKLNQAKKKGIIISCGERTCNKYAPISEE